MICESPILPSAMPRGVEQVGDMDRQKMEKGHRKRMVRDNSNWVGQVMFKI